ncbi:Hsp20/alpha crystallin family protein [Hyunsoonleella sp. 2307UL5-6]|uniref:Hsp20/alpha crystallin family protein n=1 Tax=Hyunsoonleella sp. 2307UL5-6 TaxID=3384768 RepID=UPI0039BC9C99
MSTLMNISKNGSTKNLSHNNWSNFMDDFFGLKTLPTTFPNTGITLPKVNIRETKDDYFVDLAIPGMKKEDINIDLDNDVLTISADTKAEGSENEENYTRREFGYTSFKRTFTLPDSINYGKIEAAYKDGVLSIQLPKREEAKPKPARTIKIS